MPWTTPDDPLPHWPVGTGFALGTIIALIVIWMVR